MKKVSFLVVALVGVVAGLYFLLSNNATEDVALQSSNTVAPSEPSNTETAPTEPSTSTAAPASTADTQSQPVLPSSQATAIDTGYPGLTAENSWVRAMPPGSSSTAAYMTFRNEQQRPLTIVAVESAQFEAASLHATVTNGDVVSMQPVTMIEVGGGQTASLSPNGLHVMLMDSADDFAVGDEIEITFFLRSGEQFTLNVPVRSQP